ncbi:DUF4209 domain-containing protein [Elizabethkingia meningoseptica]|uniref:DUF7380 domain-containing protein n=1 Tax=Elizabethkingia meningoseptica TaxID=238 RepID=UPI0023B127E8|nr:hypothetical protein [Elizabethkingia meningoseptica]MDE5538433.1 DUF4209 domain-containing protein [Elizabethkingia meningoseptica]
MDEIYEKLENISLTSKSTLEVRDYLNTIKFDLIEKNRLSEAEMLQWETDTFLFNINKNKLSGCFLGTDEKGLQTEYPSLKTYSEKIFNYLKERLSACKSPFLKSRYGHFLWLSPAKNISFAITAVDSYLECIILIEQLDLTYPEKYFGLQLIDTLQNLFALSTSINYKVEEVKSEVKRMIKNYPLDSTSSFVMRLDLTKLMLENKKFSNEDFRGICGVIEKVVVIKSKNDREQAITLLQQIIKIRKKLGLKYDDYERKIGNLWYLKSKEDGQINIVACKFLEKAIYQYKKVKDKSRVVFLEKQYNKLKKDIQLFQFGEEIDVSEYHRNFEIISSRISSQSTESIISILMLDDSLLPSYSKIEQQVENEKGKYLFKELFSNSVIDANGNTVQHYDDESEKKYFDILQNYNYHIQLITLPLFHHIFYACVKKQKLSAKSILQYLYDHSWLGVELELSTTGQREKAYNWLSLLAPALNEFFINIEFYLTNSQSFPNFILCVDSLSTKIEGMVRDICEFKGIIPFEFKVDHQGRTISFQKDIHKLLNEKEIINLISKDDLLLLKYVLIEKAGYNLRHKVAHSLMTFDEYNIGQMFLLVVCVLKLGKYNFVEKNK